MQVQKIIYIVEAPHSYAKVTITPNTTTYEHRDMLNEQEGTETKATKNFEEIAKSLGTFENKKIENNVPKDASTKKLYIYTAQKDFSFKWQGDAFEAFVRTLEKTTGPILEIGQ
ncbi:hypothetical protein GF342_00625 [Candidatus Woesearchaeota archaeon]|nr:hypothetical protein [Candidatus Woesearchaeota archaeon]